MIEALQFEFMRNAVLAGILASVVCGIIGTLVVVNRIVFISGGIAHAAYGGIGLAFFMGWPFLPTTLGFSVGISWVMAAVSLRRPAPRRHRDRRHLGARHGGRHHPDGPDPRIQRQPHELSLRQHPDRTARVRFGGCWR